MSKLVNLDVYRLISEVHKRPIIWDRTFPEYKERSPTNIAWMEICSNLRDDFDTVKESTKFMILKLANKKWVNIRDNWMKWNKRESFYKKHPNRKRENRRPYVYHEILSFLKKFADSKESEAAVVAHDHLNDEDGYTAKVIPQRKNKNDDYHTANVIPQKKIRNTEVPALDTTQYATQNVSPFMEKEIQERSKRHLCFFKGILPSIANLNENETLEFQIGVLNLIKSVRNTIEVEDVPVSYVNGSSVDNLDPSGKRIKIKGEKSIEKLKSDALYPTDSDLSE